MPEVTINDLIPLLDDPITTETSRGTQFVYDEDPDLNQLAPVVDGLTFNTPEGSGDIIPVGSTVEIDSVEYTLSAVHEFWGTYTKVDPETGEEFTQQGQTVSLTLEAGDGTILNFVSPSDIFNANDPWLPGDILSIEVFSTPTQHEAIYTQITDGDDDGTNKLSNDDDVTVPCFVAGTLIDTAQGRKPVEELRAGDMVLTRDNGYMPLAWSGERSITAQEISAQPEFASVILRAGALGPDLPECDTRVSPSHRVLICGQRAELLFGETEVLVPASHLVCLPGIERDDSAVTYVHIMFDTHQIVLGDGLWSESFQPADYSIDGLGGAQRKEIFALFPELAKQGGKGAFKAARMTLKAHESRLLFAA